MECKWILILLVCGIIVQNSSSQSCNSEAKAYRYILSEGCYVNVQTTVALFVSNNPRAEIEKICSSYDAVISCSKRAVAVCNSTIQAVVTRWIAEYRGRFCQDGSNNVATVVETYIGYFERVELTELSNAFVEYANAVVRALDCIQDIVFIATEYSSIFQYTRYYSAFLRCLRFELSISSMADEMKSYFMFYYFGNVVPMGVNIDSDVTIHRSFVLDPLSDIRVTVTVVGDPHIKGPDGKYITCGAEGEVDYLKNKYVTIKGTNTAAAPGSKATYLSAVSIGFRDSSGNTKYYSAGDSMLNTQFDDEGTATIFTGSDDEVSIEERNGTSIQFVHNKSGTTIVLTRFRHVYMLALRAAENVLEESVGLLVQGCEDEIDTGEQGLEAVCDGVDEELRHLCDYDYNVTGDAELATSVNMITDAEKLAKVKIFKSNNAAASTVGSIFWTLIAAYITF